ncbi:MAG: rhomboid family intramembrane serine protease [Phycisphaerae bacterium]
MFIFLPIKTDSPLRRTPVVNYAIIAANILIFIGTQYYWTEDQVRPFLLDGAAPKLYQFVSYAFLHANWTHLIGNMLFLYIFGNSLNDKLGDLEYILFYIAAAIFAGAGYIITSSNPLLGASGAIASVTTCFLVLFPRSNILVFAWIFYFIDTFEFSSLFLIGFKMILFDNVIMPYLDGGGNVAHGAHLIGYLFGFVVPLVLLAVRGLDRDQFDILALWSRVLRRRQFATVASQQNFFTGQVDAAGIDQSGDPAPNHTAPMAQLRNAIYDALSRYDLTTAVEKYRQLINLDPRQVLPRKEQLEIANQLMSLKDFPLAADAYEKYLKGYSDDTQIDQVRLLLGIIYGRYLVNTTRARELLDSAKVRLTDPNQVALCDEELRRLDHP